MADHPFGDEAVRADYRAIMADSPETPHPDESTWERLAVDELNPAERTAVFDHITACATCARTWRGVIALAADARAEGLIPAPPAARSSWITGPAIRYALAATLVIAVGGLIVSRRPAPDDVAPQLPSAPAVATPPVATAPPAWLAAFPLSKADIHVRPEEALAPRGSAALDGEPSIERLGAALEPYRRDDFAEAVRRLDPLSREFPKAGRAGLYLGVSLLQIGRYEEAIAPLGAATLTTQPEVAADAQWYLAVALARANQLDKAAAELRPLCQANGADTARACAALRALEGRR